MDAQQHRHRAARTADRTRRATWSGSPAGRPSPSRVGTVVSYVKVSRFQEVVLDRDDLVVLRGRAGGPARSAMLATLGSTGGVHGRSGRSAPGSGREARGAGSGVGWSCKRSDGVVASLRRGPRRRPRPCSVPGGVDRPCRWTPPDSSTAVRPDRARCATRSAGSMGRGARDDLRVESSGIGPSGWPDAASWVLGSDPGDQVVAVEVRQGHEPVVSGALVWTVKTSHRSRCFSSFATETSRSTLTPGWRLPDRSSTALEPNPAGSERGHQGDAHGRERHTPRAPPRRARQPRVPDPDPVQTGPHACTRRSRRRRPPAAPRRGTRRRRAAGPNSSSTVSANATSATGGRSARSGLPARKARAWAENTAAHVRRERRQHERRQGRRRGDLQRAPAVPPAWTRRAMARSVSIVGSPCQVAGREDQESDDDQEPDGARRRRRAARFRSLHAHASSRRGQGGDQHPLAWRRAHEDPTDRDRRRRAQQAGGERRAIRRCVRAGVPEVPAIVRFNLMDGGRTMQSQPARVRASRACVRAALQLRLPVDGQGVGVDG